MLIKQILRMINKIMIFIISLYNVKAFDNLPGFKWITVKELNGQSQITSSGHEVSFDKNNVLHLIKKNRYENTVLLKDKTDETAHSFVIGNGAYWAKKVDPDARILIKEK